MTRLHIQKNVDHNVNNNTTTGRNDFPNNSAGVAGVGAGQRHHDRHNAGHDTQGGMNPQQQGFGGTVSSITTGQDNRTDTYAQGAQGAQGGYTQGADPYSNTAGYNDPSIPPANQINTGQHGGGGARMAGKVEHAVGSMIGSQALKTKGMQKEQEAESYKQQSAEIGEAERLEKEALLRRERAVQHGNLSVFVDSESVLTVTYK